MSSATPTSHPKATALSTNGSNKDNTKGNKDQNKQDAPTKSGTRTTRIPTEAPVEDNTFILRVINTITYRQTKLNVKKEFTIKDVHAAYTPYEAHPEYYLWKDMYGKTMDSNKTLTENGLVGEDEVVEFDGVGKEPCILLIFKDGFEDKFPASLNPTHKKRFDATFGLCRNY